MMRAKEIFEGISQKMLIDFEQIQAKINHAGERGEKREQALRNFLSKYLPQKYTVGTGQILDPYGNISRQCDIVIYDAFNSPLILADEGYQIFPIESVFGVIEVKSILDVKSLKESIENIKSVKALERDEPVAGFLFAYRTRYKSSDPISVAAEAFSRENQLIMPDEQIDLVCILEDGIITNADPDGGTILVFTELEPTILLYFLYQIIEILSTKKISKPNFISYATRGEIGLVKIIKPD